MVESFTCRVRKLDHAPRSHFWRIAEWEWEVWSPYGIRVAQGLCRSKEDAMRRARAWVEEYKRADKPDSREWESFSVSSDTPRIEPDIVRKGWF